ncbi:hypothetical protein ACFLTL_01300 [Chloroflexota bacterium]
MKKAMVPVSIERRKTTRRGSRIIEADTSGIVAFCPKCKTLETLWFACDILIQTTRFHQNSGRVYHECGSVEPCHLYRTF